MIDAGSVRVGNMFMRPIGSVVSVVDISQKGFNYQDVSMSGGWHSFDDGKYLQPIPLTEDWLLKFGFGKIGEEEYSIKAFDFNLKSKTFFIGATNPYYLKVEHVHQLQNLYFALTGEELIIKP